MNDTVYTIGYSGFSIKEFIEASNANGISLVADVRSNPYSQYYHEYNKEPLDQTLKRSGIHYQSYAWELGGMQTDKRYLTATGHPDFELLAKSEAFMEGFDKLKHVMAQGGKFALMCAKKDPFRCHRAILISRVFHNAGYKVIHLMPNGISITQEDIENRLLEAYFPEYGQLSLFSESLARNDLITLAYRKKNEDMGKHFLRKKKS